MFNRRKMPNPAEKFNPNRVTLISASTTLPGDVRSDNDLRIDGTIHNQVSSSSKIFVGPPVLLKATL